jgi:hypothetical protein
VNFDLYIWLAYLLSAVLFILGLKQLSSPETARRGNRVAAVGMLLAIVATLLDRQIIDFSWILIGLVTGSLIGAIMARTVKMTAMPQMVAVFNGFGGGASGLVAAAEYVRHMGNPEPLAMDLGISIMAGTLIGGVTLSGSFVAFGKLQGIAEKAATYPLQKTFNFLLAAAAVAVAVYLIISPVDANGYLILAGLALVLGILVVIPIGGADMPVVVAHHVPGDEPIARQRLVRSLRRRSTGDRAGCRRGRGAGRQSDRCGGLRDDARLRAVGRFRARLRSRRGTGSAPAPGAGGPARGAGGRREVRHPSRCGTHARPHERAPSRGQRPVPGAL